jgi:hypothetical protein
MSTAAAPADLLLTPEQQAQVLASVAHRPVRIFYHYPCPDGVFAALAAAQFYRQQRSATPRFVPHEVYRPLKLEELQLQVRVGRGRGRGVSAPPCHCLAAPNPTALCCSQHPQADEVAYLLDYSGPDGFPQQLAQHVHR